MSLFSVLVPLFMLTADRFAQASGAHATQTITLTVDATEAPRKLLHAREVIPVSPGPLTLYYPQWIPGEHGPTGPINNLSGLTFTVNGKPLPWRRDPVDMYAVARADDLLVNASVRLPTGWKFGTGLTMDRESGGKVTFRTVSLTTLIDSPVLAAEHFRAIPISTGNPAVEMDIAADSPAALQPRQQFIDAMRKLVEEARALFGTEHYEHYNFLFTLSARVAHFGLEHHQSNDSRVAERALIDET